MTGEMANIPGDRLPSDHPQPHTGPIDGPSIWYGPEMMGDDIWIEELKPIEKAELLDAMRGVSDFGTDLQWIERRNFPLPTLGARLDALRKETIYGRGFVLLRGFQLTDFRSNRQPRSTGESGPISEIHDPRMHAVIFWDM